MDGVHVVEGLVRGQWGPGAKPGRGSGLWRTKSPEAEAKCEISVHFCFPVENLGFNEYKTVYFADTIQNI